MPAAADKYREAIELYRTTDLSITEISKLCGVNRSGLAAYIYRRHRDLMLRRNRLTASDPQKNIRKTRGPRPETLQKYRDAVAACDSEEYIGLNVSQIARLFHLDGTALAHQLHAHYPDIIPRREAERRRRGIADNTHRGVRETAVDTYAGAVRMLRDTDMTVEQAADECGVSFTGLRQHLIYYHRDLVRQRDRRRRQGKSNPEIGRLSGNGRIREMTEDIGNKYAEGVELYRTTSLSTTEIARRIGVNVKSFRHHLNAWHKPLVLARRRK